jgi:hypothetical protein
MGRAKAGVRYHRSFGLIEEAFGASEACCVHRRIMLYSGAHVLALREMTMFAEALADLVLHCGQASLLTHSSFIHSLKHCSNSRILIEHLYPLTLLSSSLFSIMTAQ